MSCKNVFCVCMNVRNVFTGPMLMGVCVSTNNWSAIVFQFVSVFISSHDHLGWLVFHVVIRSRLLGCWGRFVVIWHPVAGNTWRHIHNVDGTTYLASLSAPWPINSRTTSAWRATAARCSAVLESSSRSFRHLPFDFRNNVWHTLFERRCPTMSRKRP